MRRSGVPTRLPHHRQPLRARQRHRDQQQVPRELGRGVPGLRSRTFPASPRNLGSGGQGPRTLPCGCMALQVAYAHRLRLAGEDGGLVAPTVFKTAVRRRKASQEGSIPLLSRHPFSGLWG